MSDKAHVPHLARLLREHIKRQNRCAAIRVMNLRLFIGHLACRLATPRPRLANGASTIGASEDAMRSDADARRERRAGTNRIDRRTSPVGYGNVIIDFHLGQAYAPRSAC